MFLDISVNRSRALGAHAKHHAGTLTEDAVHQRTEARNVGRGHKCLHSARKAAAVHTPSGILVGKIIFRIWPLKKIGTVN